MKKTPPELSILSRILVRCIGVYQRAVDGRPTPCRFVPTCSNYAVEAVERHGPFQGTVLVVCRLARCHPWGGQGWDPVPRTVNDIARPQRETPCST